jgi:hypothetical protein
MMPICTQAGGQYDMPPAAPVAMYNAHLKYQTPPMLGA